MTMIATALGEPETGKQLIAEVDQAFEQAAAAHPGWKGKTFTAATKTADGWGAYVGGSDRVTFMQNLGFTQNPTIAAMQPDAWASPRACRRRTSTRSTPASSWPSRSSCRPRS